MKNYTGMDLPETAEDMERHFAGGFDDYSEDIRRYAEMLMPQYLFLRKGTKKEIGYCSHCGEEMNLKAIWPEVYAGWKHGDEINCPHCGCRVQVVTRNMTSLWDKVFFYWWEKSDADRNSIVCRGIAAERGYPGGDPSRPYETMWTDSAVLFSYGKGAVMAIRNNGEGGTYRLAKRVRSRRDSFLGTAFRSGAVIGDPIGCIREAVKGTPFRWSQWYKLERERKKGIGTDVYIRVFERFARYRAWEWLTKMGIPHILMNYAEGYTPLWPLFNWRGRTVDDIFRCHLTKDDKAVLREIRVDEYVLRAWLKWKTFQPSAALRDVADCWPEYWGPARMEEDAVKEVMTRITPGQWTKYAAAGQNDMRELTDYVDYIEQCGKLGISLDDPSVLWPKNLRAAHNRTSAQMELMEDAMLEEMYDGRRDDMKRKYECEDARSGLLIIVPEQLKDLIREGEQQHNCVGGYMRRVAEGETDVVLLRHADRPEQSYITVEVDPETGYIRQAREKYNREVQDKTAKAFLLKFGRDVRRAMA